MIKKYAEAMKKAIEAHVDEIKAMEKELKKYSKEELLERANSYGLYTDNGCYKKSWIAYDIAVKSITGYSNY